MPKYKFGKNDIFHNRLVTHPQYDVTFYFNNVYINNRISQGRNVQNGYVSLHEFNVDRTTAESNDISTGDLIYSFITKNENNSDVTYTVGASSSAGGYATVANGENITLAYPLSSSVTKNILIGYGSGPYTKFAQTGNLTTTSSIRQMYALKNTLNYYQKLSPKYSFDAYYINGGVTGDSSKGASWLPGAKPIEECGGPHQKYTGLVHVPSIFYGSRLKPGSVNLKFYITGALCASAHDEDENGELIETHGPRSGSTVGVVLYDEGLLILTGNYALDPNTNLREGYLTPTTGNNPTLAKDQTPLSTEWLDNPKWAHFGSYRSYITSSTDTASSSYAPTGSSYSLSFKGTNIVPTVTMFAHAEKNKLNWSNNPTYIERDNTNWTKNHLGYQDIFVSVTSSQLYKENELVKIKNTLSSSFENFTSSYRDQTYISKINVYDGEGDIVAVAKLATPVIKNNEKDYTFKLKLDI
jgi:hypothetical protein